MDTPDPPPPPPPPSAEAAVVTARPVLGLPGLAPPSPLTLPWLSRRAARLDLGLIVLVLLLVPFGSQLSALFLAGDFDMEDLGPPPASVLIVHKWFDLLLAAAVLVYLLERHRLPPAAFGLSRARPGVQMLWAAGNLAAAYTWLFSTLIALTLLLAFFPQAEQDLWHRMRELKQLPIKDLRASVLLLIPVALHEELLFRGLLLPYLRRVSGSWTVALLVSTAIFAVLHFNQGWMGVLQVSGVGLLFGIFFVASRSLLTVAAAHFAFNFLQFQLIRLLPG